MKHFKDENIKDAFTSIRAEFEERKNETGLDILGIYEEQWNETGSLSDRQRAWIERQLHGTWRDAGSKPVLNATVTADPTPKEEAELLDAMIEHRMAAQGKVFVDAETMARFKKVMSDLNDALGGMDR